MQCPKCNDQNDKVIDSRSARNGAAIRRRRRCLHCGYRFTTYEEVLKPSLRVVKRDGRRELFDRKKLMGGVERACEKRPISMQKIEQLIDLVMQELEAEYDREAPSPIIGRKVMAYLKDLDEVAYVRFASVYRRFRDVTEFVSEIKDLQERE